MLLLFSCVSSTGLASCTWSPSTVWSRASGGRAWRSSRTSPMRTPHTAWASSQRSEFTSTSTSLGRATGQTICSSWCLLHWFVPVCLFWERWGFVRTYRGLDCCIKKEQGPCFTSPTENVLLLSEETLFQIRFVLWTVSLISVQKYSATVIRLNKIVQAPLMVIIVLGPISVGVFSAVHDSDLQRHPLHH